MLLTCPNCGTQYDVDASAIGPSGRMVRCEKCAHRWRAMPENPVAAPVQPTPPPYGAAPGPSAEQTQWGGAPVDAGRGRQVDELRQILHDVQNQPQYAPPPQGPQAPTGYGAPAYGAPQQPPYNPAGQAWAPQAPMQPGGGLPPLPGQGGYPPPPTSYQPAPAYGQPAPPYEAPAPEQEQRIEKRGRGRRGGAKPYDRERAVRRQLNKERKREARGRRNRRSTWMTLLAFLGIFGGGLGFLYQNTDALSANFPESAPALSRFVGTVDNWSAGIGGFFSNLFSEVSDKVDEVTE